MLETTTTSSSAAPPSRRSNANAERTATITALLLGLTLSSARAENGTDWDMYNGDYAGRRYSTLTQISTKNVSKLRTVCMHQIPEGVMLESGLVVHDGVIFVTTTHDTWALDATDCRLRWHEHEPPAANEPFDTNRGVALAGSRVIRGMPSGHLIALDAASGRVVWKVRPADASRGEFLSSAPIAWQDLVFIGTAGSDWGVKGRMMALDSATGRLRWTFNTIPTGREAGANTWRNAKATATGGGATWTSYTIDTRRAEIFVPVGNPAPDHDGSERPGDDLFTDSLVVLDAHTGKLKWWYQLVKHDVRDADLAAPPMLYSLKANHMVAFGGKDGYLYSVDRDTHRPRFRTAVTTIRNSSAVPSKQGAYACPGVLGGVEWNGPALDLTHDSILVNAVDWCSTFILRKEAHSIGQPFNGGYAIQDLRATARGWLTAVDALSGRIRWQYHAPAPLVAGVTSTAAGIAFTGDVLGNFVALDSGSGRVLFNMKAPGSIAGGVVTYSVGGTQFLALTCGSVSRTGLGLGGVPTVIILDVGRSALPHSKPRRREVAR